MASTVQQRDLEAKFERLAAKWRQDCEFLSSVSEIAMHPAYQQIVGMGENSLPYIFADLERQPDHWFWALKAITGEDPVPETDRGDLRAMTSAWLTWARSHNFL